MSLAESVRNSVSTTSGRFKTSMTNLIYKKAYVLGGKVYLLDVTGLINKNQVKAKEVVYNGYKSYLLKKYEIHIKFRG